MAIILFFISVIRWEYPPPNIESQIKLRYPQSVILDGIKCDGFPYLFVFVKSLAPQNALPATGKMKILIFQKNGVFLEEVTRVTPEDQLQEIFNCLIKEHFMLKETYENIFEIFYLFSLIDMLLYGYDGRRISYPFVPIKDLNDLLIFQKIMKIEDNFLCVSFYVIVSLMHALLSKNISKCHVFLWEEMKNFVKQYPVCHIKKRLKKLEISVFYVFFVREGFKVIEWKAELNENGRIIKIKKIIKSDEKGFNIFRIIRGCVWG